MTDMNPNTPLDEAKCGPGDGRPTSNGFQHLDLAQKALDIAGVILIALDPSGNVMFLNRRGHEILEYPDEELIGRNWYQTCLPERDREAVASSLGQLMAEGVAPVAHFENWIVTRSGKELLVAWYNTVLTDPDGRCVGTLSSGEDITQRRQAEEAIQREKAFSDAIIDSLPGPFYVLNERGRYVRWNKVQEELIGLPPEKIPSIPSLSTIHKDDRREMTRKTAQVFSDGYATVEARQRNTDQTLCFVGKRMDIGDATFVVGMGIDITDRKRAEQTLRESEERFRGVVETSPDAIALLDTHGRILMVNRQAARLSNYASVEDNLANCRDFSDVVAPEDQALAASKIRKVLVRGGPGTFEICMVRRDGSRWPAEIRCSVVRDQHGKPTSLITVARDITERKLAEQRQARSLRRLESVNWLQEDLLLPESLDEKFRRITEAAIELVDLDFCRIWVVEPGDLCDRGCIHGTAGKQRDGGCLREKCLHLLASAGRYTQLDGQRRRVPLGWCKIGRIAIENERRFLTNNATTDPHVADHQWAIDLGLTSFAGYQLHDTDGAPIGVLAVFAKHTLSEEDDALLLNLSELTSRVILDSHARAELQETRRRAIAASEAKSEFLANMSHEIRTPMTAILGFTDLLMSPNLSPEEHREFIETIGRNGRSLLVLINDILDLSKIEAAKIAIESVTYSLHRLIDDVLEVVHVRAQEKGLGLQVICESEIPDTIQTDPTRLRQILVNLVGNAIKFTEHGGVRVAIRKGEGQGSAKLQFAVSDTGIGIEPEKIGGLFQPFAQADASTTRRFGGTGLGLAISQRLANLLDGDIQVTSRFGYGSTFTLTIDIGDSEKTSAPPATIDFSCMQRMAPASEREARFSGRVLLAEDSPDLQRFLGHVLRRMHVDLDIAENGQLACEKAVKSRIEGTPYDLILMDMQMPKMDGLQATRFLRKHDWQGPIVALTAHAMSEHREGCLAAGCDDYLAKPVQVSDLRAILSRHVGRHADEAKDAPEETHIQATVTGQPHPA